MKYKRVLVNGITGAGASEAVSRFCSGAGLVHLDVGRMVEDLARASGTKLTSSNVLQAPPDTLNILSFAATEILLRKLDRLAPGTGVMVDTHFVFLRTTGLVEGTSFQRIQEIEPEVIITIIDGPTAIHGRLKRDPRQYFHLTISDIVKWQELEVYLANLYARLLDKEHIVVPFSEFQQVLASFLVDQMPKAYVSYPMTNLPEEQRPRRDSFVRDLKKRFTLFNPASIESAHDARPFYSFEDQVAISSHTITRDLEWFIRLNDSIVVAYMLPGVFSSGSNDEVRYAYEIGRETYIVVDEPGTRSEGGTQRFSPFTTYKAVVFPSPEEFFYFWDLPRFAKDVYKTSLRVMHVLAARNPAGVALNEFEVQCLRYINYHLDTEEQETASDALVKGVIARVYRSWVWRADAGQERGVEGADGPDTLAPG